MQETNIRELPKRDAQEESGQQYNEGWFKEFLDSMTHERKQNVDKD